MSAPALPLSEDVAPLLNGPFIEAARTAGEAATAHAGFCVMSAPDLALSEDRRAPAHMRPST